MAGTQVSATWEDRPLGTTTTGQLAKLFQENSNSPADFKIYEPRLNPSFTPVGGLGIYVIDGWASFRNVTVEQFDR
jgi:hypothetical protein